jgi:hypothetical protein
VSLHVRTLTTVCYLPLWHWSRIGFHLQQQDVKGKMSKTMGKLGQSPFNRLLPLSGPFCLPPAQSITSSCANLLWEELRSTYSAFVWFRQAALLHTTCGLHQQTREKTQIHTWLQSQVLVHRSMDRLKKIGIGTVTVDSEQM